MATSTPSGTLLDVRATTLALLIAITLLATPRAHAATPGDAAEPNAKSWVGRYCTPTGCAGALSSPFAQAAGFGAASLAILFLARRRRA
jgi:hypothetical protein